MPVFPWPFTWWQIVTGTRLAGGSGGTFPAANEALESEEVRNYTDPFFGDSPIGATMSDSVLEFSSFYNGPDTSAIGAALLNALVDMEAGNVKPADAWKTGLDSAKAAIGG